MQTTAATELELLRVVCECIREAKEIPSGHLYAMLMPSGMSLSTYERLIARIKGTGLVEETPAHLLKWIEPKGSE